MTTDSTILLQAKSLTIGYGTNILLKDLDLSMKAGELICFMGRNGVGKSTLIRTLAGLQQPLSGQVEFSSGKELQRQIAVVLTDRISANNMTVLDLITFGRYPYLGWNVRPTKDDEKIIRVAIDKVRIHDLVDRQLQELSDGQLQMAMIARALAQDTAVIVLDEPTAHLDLNNRIEVMNVLRALARQMKKAILVATHELDLALQTADIVWLAGLSQNILTGIPEDLVLSGAFDRVFQFKGFDLLTGKVQHEAYRQKSIRLSGKGHEYLWTKNALERNGYPLAESAFTHNVTVETDPESGMPVWTINHKSRMSSLKSLMDELASI